MPEPVYRADTADDGGYSSHDEKVPDADAVVALFEAKATAPMAKEDWPDFNSRKRGLCSKWGKSDPAGIVSEAMLDQNTSGLVLL